MGYRKLAVYEKSYKAVLDIYQMSEKFPERERYAMGDQIRRAAMSIPMNIAEGYAKRGSANEFKRFLFMAKGSANEMEVLLDLSRDLGFIDTEKHTEMQKECAEINRILGGMLSRWK